MSQILSLGGGPGSGDILTLTGDSGGAISPDGSGNINVITGEVSGPYANGTPNFVGTANTLTWTAADTANNCGIGTQSLLNAFISGANQNTALGNGSGSAVDGSDNVYIGINAGNNDTGSQNTYVGAFTGGGTSGDRNICIGHNTGSAFNSAENSNIYFNTTGVAADTNTLRIGQATGSGPNQNLQAAFICGINGVNVGSVASVVSISGDQLGSSTITAGAGISVTPGANTITISSTGNVPWNNVAGTSASMAVNQGYIANNAGLVTLTLPAVAAQGSVIRVAGQGAGGWTIAQNAGQLINDGSSTTTTGVTGSLSSTNRFDAVELLCTVVNTTFNVLSSQGNLTIV